MKRITIGAAALAAVAIPTTGFAVYSTDEDPLETYALEITVIDLQAHNICDAVQEAVRSGLDLETVIDVGVDSFAEGWGPDFPTDLRLYVAGMVVGCAS